MLLECHRPVRRTIATSLLTLIASLTVAAGALAAGGLTPQSSDSPNAAGIHRSYLLVGYVALAVFILVEGVLLAFVIKFRRGKRTRLDEGPQIHGSTKLELIWTVAPAIALAGIASFVLATLPKIRDIPKANAAGGRLDVTVEGHQFYWLFKYPNGAIGFDQMLAPTGKNVKLTVVAPAKDVIHSWWVPKLGGKVDAIPGRTNYTWYRAPAPGVYIGQCAELCGIQHAKMRNSVRVVQQGEYTAYTQRQKQLLGARSKEFGKQEWDHVCAKCHRLDPAAERLIGPNLGANPLLLEKAGLGSLVRNGRGEMPPVGANWSDEQVEALVAYTKTVVKVNGSGGVGNQG
jgi:cytochrome c oxidase subunit 2